MVRKRKVYALVKEKKLYCIVCGAEYEKGLSFSLKAKQFYINIFPLLRWAQENKYSRENTIQWCDINDVVNIA